MRYSTSNLMRTSPLLRQGRGQASWKRVVSFAFAIGGAVALAPSGTAHAQWVTVHEQAYYPADHNWSFRKHYRSADRLFNAFDYGHAILYETLWTKPDAPKRLLEEDRYRFLTENLLVNPPSVPLVEDAIEPMYSRLVPEAKAMFEWAHVLHRQLYDVLGDPRLSEAERDSEARRIMDYYFSRPDIAFSRKPKSMALMQEQPYSLAFRKGYPKFNGLIWGYHWLQVGLYEPLLVGGDLVERRALVDAAVARFRQMMVNPPAGMPHQMPMTAAVAPTFADRFPEAAIVFDNLHSMHDVISDILANPDVPRDRKRAEILLAAERFRDDTSYVMTVEAWRAMSEHMGIENQGGPAVGFLPELPQPTVSYGAVMQHDPHTGEMTGISYGEAIGGAHQDHGAPAAAQDADSTGSDAHAGHATEPPRDSTSQDAHAAHRMDTPPDTAAPMHDPEMHARHHAAAPDTTRRAVSEREFDALQQRGMVAMGVDQEESRHVFESLPDGGRIDYRTAPSDSAGVRTIRNHLYEIRDAFAAGNFDTPAFVHAGEVPGTGTMAARRLYIRYHVEEVDGGGVLHIRTRDEAALRAVHEFLAFQRQDHRTDSHPHDARQQ